MDLKRVWSYEPEVRANAVNLAADSGVVAVARDCAEFLQGPNLVKRYCTYNEFSDVSASEGKFLMGNYDGHVYLFDASGELLWSREVGLTKSISVFYDGKEYVTCGSSCAKFDEEGKKLWEVEIGNAFNGPHLYKGKLYVPDQFGSIIILDYSTGNPVGTVEFEEMIYDLAICGNLMAVGGHGNVYLFELDEEGRPKEKWRRGGLRKAWNVAFSPDCQHLAVAESGKRKLRVYDARGRLVAKEGYSEEPQGLDWKDYLYVGFESGRVEAYELKPSDLS